MNLQVASRTLTGKKVSRIRREGLVPAIVYAKTMSEQEKVSFVKNDFLKIYRTKGLSLPIQLAGDSSHMVVVKDYSLDPVTSELLHVDFLAVNKDEQVEMSVQINFLGVSPIEKAGEGQLQYVRDSLLVSAKPADLPGSLEFDVSSIVDVNDVIVAQNIALPKGVVLLEEEDAAVITVSSLMGEDPEEEEEEGGLMSSLEAEAGEEEMGEDNQENE